MTTTTKSPTPDPLTVLERLTRLERQVTPADIRAALAARGEVAHDSTHHEGATVALADHYVGCVVRSGARAMRRSRSADERAVAHYVATQVLVGGWHPEDDPATVVEVATGHRTFRNPAAIGRLVDTAWSACARLQLDPYALAMSVA